MDTRIRSGGRRTTLAIKRKLRAALLAGSFLAYSSLAAGEDRKPWNVNMSFMEGEEECLPPPVAGTGQYGRHPYSYTIKYGYQGMTVSGVGVITKVATIEILSGQGRLNATYHMELGELTVDGWDTPPTARGSLNPAGGRLAQALVAIVQEKFERPSGIGGTNIQNRPTVMHIETELQKGVAFEDAFETSHFGRLIRKAGAKEEVEIRRPSGSFIRGFDARVGMDPPHGTTMGCYILPPGTEPALARAHNGYVGASRQLGDPLLPLAVGDGISSLLESSRVVVRGWPRPPVGESGCVALGRRSRGSPSAIPE